MCFWNNNPRLFSNSKTKLNLLLAFSVVSICIIIREISISIFWMSWSNEFDAMWRWVSFDVGYPLLSTRLEAHKESMNSLWHLSIVFILSSLSLRLSLILLTKPTNIFLISHFKVMEDLKTLYLAILIQAMWYRKGSLGSFS